MLSSGHERSFICSLSFNIITVLKNNKKVHSHRVLLSIFNGSTGVCVIAIYLFAPSGHLTHSSYGKLPTHRWFMMIYLLNMAAIFQSYVKLPEGAYVYIYIHTYTYMCTLVFLPVHISTYLRCKYIYTYTYTVCMCIYIYVCVCGHMQCKDAPFFKAWNPVSKQPLHSGNLFFWDQLKIMDQDQLQLSVCRSLPY